MVKRRDVLAGLGAFAALPAAAQTTAQTGAPTAPAAAPAAAPASPALTLAPLPPPPIKPPPPGAIRISLQTAAGLILIDLFADKAPITCANFLRYVDKKGYDGGEFYRAMKVADKPLFGLIQGGLKNRGLAGPGIAHESTAQTGISHIDGTISMARGAIGTATADFFICVGDARTSLDANPKGAGDNLGFAAFGRVAGGMDVVKTILVGPTSPTAGPEGMKGTFLAAPVPIVTAKRVV